MTIETDEFTGNCGLTIQNIDSEAAKAVRDWAFENTDFDTLYSYMKYTNVGSYSTAEAIGMKKIKEYPDDKNKISYAYAITRNEWKKLKEKK